MERVNVWDVVRNTITGEKGLGGIETRGFYELDYLFNIMKNKQGTYVSCFLFGGFKSVWIKETRTHRLHNDTFTI